MQHEDSAIRTFRLFLAFILLLTSVAVAAAQPQNVTQVVPDLSTDLAHDAMQLDSVSQNKDFKNLQQLSQDLEAKWRVAGGEEYGYMLLKIAGEFVTTDFGDDNRAQAEELAQSYARKGLQPPITASLRAQVLLAKFLMVGQPSAPANAKEWLSNRANNTGLVLAVEQRINTLLKSVAPVDPKVPQEPVIFPHPPGGGYSGMPPSNIKDPVMRAQYEAAIADYRQKAKRSEEISGAQLDQKLFAPALERYLITAYSQPPYNARELKTLLDTYGVDKDTQKRILDAVAKQMRLTVEGATPDSIAPQDDQE